MTELYHFYTQLDSWRFCDASVPVVYQFIQYNPISGGIKRTQAKRETQEGSVTITVPAELEPFRLYALRNPFETVKVTVFDLEEEVFRFRGEISAVDFDAQAGEAMLQCSAIGRALSGDIPSRRLDRRCNWELFDGDCGLDRELQKVTIPVGEVVFSGNNLILEHAFFEINPDGPHWWTGGFILCGAEANYIVDHNPANRVELLFPFVRLPEPFFEVFPGCDKQFSTCQAKFNNAARFGGYPKILTRNPITQGF